MALPVWTRTNRLGQASDVLGKQGKAGANSRTDKNT